MTWRHEEVPLAYQNAFQWIFRETEAEKAWDNFATHLREDDVTQPYFINGKAGSGKSTLMKYILNDSRTLSALSQWAGDRQLLIVTFFFWNIGTPLQKKQCGYAKSPDT